MSLILKRQFAHLLEKSTTELYKEKLLLNCINDDGQISVTGGKPPKASKKQAPAHSEPEVSSQKSFSRRSAPSIRESIEAATHRRHTGDSQ